MEDLVKFIDIDSEKTYDDNVIKEYNFDFGVTTSKHDTAFSFWHGLATEVNVLIYKSDTSDVIIYNIPLETDGKGNWYGNYNENLNKACYNYQIIVEGKEKIVTDPFAVAITSDNKKGVIVDLTKTHSSEWKNKHSVGTLASKEVIYKIKLGKFSSSESSSMKRKGTYSTLLDKTSKTEEKMATGVKHLVDLNVGEVLFEHLGHYFIDENKKERLFPLMPTPTLANNKMDVAVKEFKQMVGTLSKYEIGTVVKFDYHKLLLFYKRVFKTITQEKKAPYTIADFIGKVVVFWVEKYKIDKIWLFSEFPISESVISEVDEIINEYNPLVGLVIDNPIVDEQMGFMREFGNMSFVTPTLKNALLGDKGSNNKYGFVGGNAGIEEETKKAIFSGYQKHDFINIDEIAGEQDITSELILENVVNEIDDLKNSLFNQISKIGTGLGDTTVANMYTLALSMLLTSNGTPVLSQGSEFMQHNTDLPIEWSLKSNNEQVVEYICGLIDLRNQHPAFKITDPKIFEKVLPIKPPAHNVISYFYKNNVNGDTWRNICVVHNANPGKVFVRLPQKCVWNIVVDGNEAGTNTISSFVGEVLYVPPLTTKICYTEDVILSKKEIKEKKKKTNYVGVGLAAASYLFVRNNRKKRKKDEKR